MITREKYLTSITGTFFLPRPPSPLAGELWNCIVLRAINESGSQMPVSFRRTRRWVLRRWASSQSRLVENMTPRRGVRAPYGTSLAAAPSLCKGCYRCRAVRLKLDVGLAGDGPAICLLAPWRSASFAAA